MLPDHLTTRVQHQQQYIHQQQDHQQGSGMASESSTPSLPRLSNITSPLSIHPLSSSTPTTRKTMSFHPHRQQQQQQQPRLPSIGSVGANLALEEDLKTAATMLRPPAAMQQQQQQQRSSLMHPGGVMDYVDTRMKETYVAPPGSSKSSTLAADTFSGKNPHAGNTRFQGCSFRNLTTSF